MKIVQVCPRYHPYIGGVEKYVKQVSEELVKKGFDIMVYTTDPTGSLPREEEINGVIVKRFKSFAPSEIGFLSIPLYKALKNTRCDIVHAHGYRALPMLFSALAKKWNKAKLMVTLHLGFSKIGKRFYSFYNPVFGHYIFSRADKIVIVSPAELEEIPILRKYMDKIVLIPIGIDVRNIVNYPSKKDRDTLNLIYVGRIEMKKGIDKLVEIMHSVEGMPIHLTIVGEGPYAAKLISLIKGVDNVEFIGKVSEHELYKLYSRAHIFILLSEFEAHSVSLTEAMAFGLVPIVSNVGGNKYIVDEKTGFLVNYPVKTYEVVELLIKLYHNRNLLEKKSIAAKKKALSMFRIDKHVNSLIRLYEEIYAKTNEKNNETLRDV